jgi:hypothetical protein
MRKKNKPAKFDDVQIENGAVNDLGERIWKKYASTNPRPSRRRASNLRRLNTIGTRSTTACRGKAKCKGVGLKRFAAVNARKAAGGDEDEYMEAFIE